MIGGGAFLRGNPLYSYDCKDVWWLQSCTIWWKTANSGDYLSSIFSFEQPELLRTWVTSIIPSRKFSYTYPSNQSWQSSRIRWSSMVFYLHQKYCLIWNFKPIKILPKKNKNNFHFFQIAFKKLDNYDCFNCPNLLGLLTIKDRSPLPFKGMIFRFNGKNRWGGREVREVGGEITLISRLSKQHKSSNY